MVDIFIALEVGGRCSGALAGDGLLPLHHHTLLAAQDGTDSLNGSHGQIAVLVLADHVPVLLLVVVPCRRVFAAWIPVS